MRFISRFRGILANLKGFKLVLSVSDTLLRLETPERYSLQFTYRDRPIPKADLNLYANERLISTRQTDLDGRLSDTFNFTEPGVYNLQARFEQLSLTVESNVVTVRAGLFRLTIGSSEGGSTSPGLGTYEYRQGSAIQVQAVPSSGYEFDHWTVDDVEAGTANPIPLTIDWDHKLLPFFRKLLAPPPAGATWGGHPIRVGETWPDAGGSSYYTIVDGALYGFPNQPWVRWRTNDGRDIDNWPILSVAQRELYGRTPGTYRNPGYRTAVEDAYGIAVGQVWTGDQDAAEYAMRNAAPAWS